MKAMNTETMVLLEKVANGSLLSQNVFTQWSFKFTYAGIVFVVFCFFFFVFLSFRHLHRLYIWRRQVSISSAEGWYSKGLEWETVFVLFFFVLLGFSCSAFAFGRDRYRNARLEFLIKRMRVLQLRLFCSKLGKANERVYLWI